MRLSVKIKIIKFNENWIEKSIGTIKARIFLSEYKI